MSCNCGNPALYDGDGKGIGEKVKDFVAENPKTAVGIGLAAGAVTATAVFKTSKPVRKAVGLSDGRKRKYPKKKGSKKRRPAKKGRK